MPNTDHGIVILGAGMSGIAMGVALLKAGRSDFLILEEASGVGGTWWHNRYPGAQCDVPSHLYCFSFAPNPNWTRVYAPGDEIQRYAEDCVANFGLRPHLRLGTRIESADYDALEQCWTIRTGDGNAITARHFIASMGPLHRPKWPAGVEKFSGPILHTARWDQHVSLVGKRVAVIGSAASAVQVIPAIVDQCSRLDVYQRTPSWIVPRGDRPYPNWARKLLTNRFLGILYRWGLYLGTEATFPAFRQRGVLTKVIRWVAERHLLKQVRDGTLRRQLTPNYPVGCKRVLLSDTLYPALQRSHVTLRGQAAEFTSNGICDETSAVNEVDVIICATGFDTLAPLGQIRITGVSGLTLMERWKSGPEAYCGTVVDGFPNLWLLLGPNTGTGHTSVLIPIEAQVQYVVRCLKELDHRKSPSMTIRPEAVQTHNAALQTRLAKTVWASPLCMSWYKTTEGRVLGTYPGYISQFRASLRRPRFSDYIF
jgi:hypothetical protein